LLVCSRFACWREALNFRTSKNLKLARRRKGIVLPSTPWIQTWRTRNNPFRGVRITLYKRTLPRSSLLKFILELCKAPLVHQEEESSEPPPTKKRRLGRTQSDERRLRWKRRRECDPDENGNEERGDSTNQNASPTPNSTDERKKENGEPSPRKSATIQKGIQLRLDKGGSLVKDKRSNTRKRTPTYVMPDANAASSQELLDAPGNLPQASVLSLLTVILETRSHI